MTTRTSLCVLGSGSSGNSSVLTVERPGRERYVALIDLGLSPRRTKRSLESLSIEPGEVRAVLLTHFDSDHFHCAWVKAVQRGRPALRAGGGWGFSLRFHRHHRPWAHRAGATYLPCDCFHTRFDLDEDIHIRPIHLAHDHRGTVGYRIETSAGALGYATDLGRVPPDLLDAFDGVDLLALESNYCPVMQRESNRPLFLKRRIMGGAGHLSNEESFEAVRALDGTSNRLRHVCLIHLSRECNDPSRIRALYDASPPLARRLTISTHNEPTPWLSVGQCDGLARQSEDIGTADRAIP